MGTGSGGPEVQDQKSGDQMGSGPNELQPVKILHGENPVLALYLPCKELQCTDMSMESWCTY